MSRLANYRLQLPHYTITILAFQLSFLKLQINQFHNFRSSLISLPAFSKLLNFQTPKSTSELLKISGARRMKNQVLKNFLKTF